MQAAEEKAALEKENESLSLKVQDLEDDLSNAKVELSVIV